MKTSDYEFQQQQEAKSESQLTSLLLIGCGSIGAVAIGADLAGCIQLMMVSPKQGGTYLGIILVAALLSAAVSFVVGQRVFELKERRLLNFTLLGAGFAGGLIPLPFLVTQPHLLYGMAAGAGVGAVFSFLVLSGRAYRDATRMRVQLKARNLTEDAWTEYARGEAEKAESLLVEALSVCEKRLGESDLVTLVTLHSLANLYRVSQLFEKAHHNYQRCVPLYERLVRDNLTAHGLLGHHIALNYFGTRQYREAIQEAENAYGKLKSDGTSTPEQRGEVQALLARCHVALKSDEQAVEHYRKALDEVGEVLGHRHPTVVTLLGALSGCFIRLQRFQESEGFLENLVEQLDYIEEPDYEIIVEGLLDLGRVRVEQGKYDEARPLYTKGLRLLQQEVGPNDRLLEKILEGFQFLVDRHTGGSEGVVDLLVLFRGEREKIRQLVEEHPGWINSRDRTGWGPLQWTIFMGREDLASWLLRKGAEPDFDSDKALGPLHVAAAWGRRQAVVDLLQTGVDVDARGPQGWTPIFWASHFGRVRLVELMLKKGASVDFRDDEGQTALHRAAAGGHSQTLLALISANARVNAKEKSKSRTALHLAVERNHIKAVEVLMLNGAHVDVEDADGVTPLALATEKGHRLLARFMKKFLTGRGRWEGMSEAAG